MTNCPRHRISYTIAPATAAAPVAAAAPAAAVSGERSQPAIASSAALLAARRSEPVHRRLATRRHDLWPRHRRPRARRRKNNAERDSHRPLRPCGRFSAPECRCPALLVKSIVFGGDKCPSSIRAARPSTRSPARPLARPPASPSVRMSVQPVVRRPRGSSRPARWTETPRWGKNASNTHGITRGDLRRRRGRGGGGGYGMDWMTAGVVGGWVVSYLRGERRPADVWEGFGLERVWSGMIGV